MTVKTITLVAVTAIALFAAIGTAWRLDAREAKKPYPKAIPPPPASPVFNDLKDPAPDEAEIEARERNHYPAHEQRIESALASRDPDQREVVFAFLLPELLQVQPDRVVAMVARQERGEPRDTLRDEVARQWADRDRDAAVAWMKSLEDHAERRHTAKVAVEYLAPISPENAIYVAQQFAIGQDNGLIEHLVQDWAESSLPDAERWIASQPDDAHTAALRARIERVRDQQKPDDRG
ncbi:MAG TPA: hypothetical protein VJP84_09750 [Steroidobacteraceae bacterium]|jgi:DNA-binding transcriptional regulator YbjK|nr:hypothetical protein [Steroidobacteraceae bacterium]